MGNENTILDASAARHLVKRTGFGATKAEVAALQGLSRGAAADKLLGYKPKNFKPGGRYHSEQHNAWLKFIIKTKTPLMDKLVLFWHDHFATSIAKVENTNLMKLQIARLYLSAKGNFKTFVKQMNTDAAMIEFLDTVRNDKEIPNENYARELQELFTLGVLDSNGAANYTQQDIVQIARAFTGWNYEYRSGKPYLNTDGHDYAADFPERGPKVIYQSTGGFGAGGRSFAANGEGTPEIDTVVDIIFDHVDTDGKNTVARRTARRLLEYFAHENPSITLIDQVVTDSDFATPAHPNQWSIQALLRAIFCSDGFYDSAAVAPFAANTAKSVRWPLDLVIGTLRIAQLKLKSKYLYISGGEGPVMFDQLTNMGQTLLAPPSVFGWDWETSWISSATLLARFGFARDIAYSRSGGGTGFHPEKLINSSLSAPGAIVDAVTDVLGVGDQFTAAERQTLIDFLTDNGTISSFDLNHIGLYGTTDQKLRGLFALVMQTPQYQLH